MKLGITLIVAGILAWCWFIASVLHPLSPAQWFWSVVLLYLFMGPGVHVLMDTGRSRHF